MILLTAWSCVRSSLSVGKPAPDFSTTTIGEEHLQLSDFKNSYTIIYFWRTDCEPCRLRHEDFMQVYEKYQNARFLNGYDLSAIGVALEGQQSEVFTAVRTDKLRIQYHVLDVPPTEHPTDAPLAKLYKVDAIPAIFLVDGQGILIGKAITIAELDALLKQQLL